MRVRRFVWGDLHGVVQLQNAVALGGAGESRATADSFSAYWQRAGGRPERDLWVVEGDGGAIEAYGGLKPWHSVGWLQVEVVVRPELRRQGLGDALLERLVGEAEARGARFLGATVPDEQVEAGEFLRRHGFAVFVARLHMRLQPIVVPAGPRVSGYRIREVGTEESAALAELTNASYADEEGVGAADAPGYRRYMQESGARVWMAEDLRHLRAMGLCEVVEREVVLEGRAVASGHIGSLAVRPGARRHGLGRWLLATGARACLDTGWPTVELNVDRDNAPALALYESAGFRPVYGFSVYRRSLE